MNLTRALLLCLALSACTDEATRPTPTDCGARRAEVAKLETEIAVLTREAREALGEEASALAWAKVETRQLELYRARFDAHGCP